MFVSYIPHQSLEGQGPCTGEALTQWTSRSRTPQEGSAEHLHQVCGENKNAAEKRRTMLTQDVTGVTRLSYGGLRAVAEGRVCPRGVDVHAMTGTTLAVSRERNFPCLTPLHVLFIQ